MKPISIARTSKKAADIKLLNSKGFSIIEVLIAFALVAIMFAIIPFGGEDGEQADMKESLTLMNRAVRFSVNEAILRNVIVRMRLDLSSSPVEYFIEYGSGPSLVLPEFKDFSRLSYRERLAEEKRIKKFDNQFTPIKELEDGPQTLPEDISVYAVGTTYNPDLILEGNASIYFYPTGERDNALIIFNSEIEVATLDISPFEDKTFEKFFGLSEDERENLTYTLEAKGKEIFEEWLKN